MQWKDQEFGKLSGFTRSVCPNCDAPYAPRVRTCGTCGRKRDQKTLGELTVERAAVHAETLRGYRKNRGIIKAVRILPAPGCCPVCTADDGEFLLDAVPSLPHNECTSPRGCRCCYSAVTVNYERDQGIGNGTISESTHGAETVIPKPLPHSLEPPLLNWLRRMIGDS